MGMKVALVIARESGDVDYSYLRPDLVIVGNEPDVSGPSSWSMSPCEYVKLWNKQHFDCPISVAGQASGRLNWLSRTLPHLHDVSYIDVHPYGKDALAAEALLRKHKKYGYPLIVGEWNRPKEEVIDYVEMLANNVEIGLWFCWQDYEGFEWPWKGDTMNVGQGILDKMAAEGDHPIVDSTFVTNSDGSHTEKCMGAKGIYLASNASGHWEVIFAPFG